MDAVWDISRTALRWFASADMSCAAGSYRLSMETAVRNTSMVLDCGTDVRKSTTARGSPRSAASCFLNWSSSPCLGSHPFQSRKTVSSRSEEHTSELQSLRHLVCRL